MSRLDFRLEGLGGACWVEVKSVTLVEDGVARFPDAPTERGARHLQELARAVEEGDRAAVVFIVQRADAGSFAPNDGADREFGRVLRAAASAGVEVFAWSCRVSRQAIEVARRVPVDLT
jgi:sugar fermentation stimulation protein A